MSETNTPSNTTAAPAPEAPKVAPAKPALITTPLIVERNGVSLTFIDEIKEKGLNVGDHFVTLDPMTTANDLFVWLGNQDIFDIVSAQMRKQSLAVTASCVDAEGNNFKPEQFKKLIATLAGGVKESMKELNQKMADLVKQFITCDFAANPTFGLKLQGELQEISSTIEARKAMGKAAAAEATEEAASAESK